MTTQSDRQASVRSVTGTALTYEGDWMALFDAAGIPKGDFNGRMLAWVNLKLSANYTELNGAMQALAAANGAVNFSSLGTFNASTGGGGPTPYLGLVATRIQPAQYAGAAYKYLNCRTAHTAIGDITDIRLAYANFCLQSGNPVEQGSGSAATFTCAIEYPSGTFTQVKTGGVATGSLASVPNVGPTSEVGVTVTDPVTIAIPNGASFWVRTFWNCPGGLFYSDGLGGGAAAAGEAFNFSATVLSDLTMGGTITDSAGGAYRMGPVAIIGTTTKPSVILNGDSICWGAGDNPNATTYARGVLQHGITDAGIASLNLASYGSTTSLWTSLTPGRQVLFPYCTHAIFQGGWNDFFNGPNATSAQLQSYQATAAALFPSRVVKHLTTITPGTTGSWSTLVGQSTKANEAQRVAYNTAVRAGVSGFADYWEIADQLESSRNSGLWTVSPAPPYTADGIHPNVAGVALTTTYGDGVAATKIHYP